MKKTLFLLLFIPIISFTQNEKDIYKEADSLLFSNDFLKSIPLYNKLISVNKSNQEYYRGRGYAYFLDEKYNKAEIDYLKAVELNPNCLNCFINLSQIYLGQENKVKAIEYANKAISIDSNARGKTQRGKVYYSMSEIYDALFDFNDASKENPKNYENYYYSSKCYREMKFKDKAINKAFKLLEIDPENVSFVYFVSETYNRLNEFEKAIPYLEKCIELDSNKFLFYRDLAASNGSLGKKNKSIALYKKSMQKGNKSPYDYSLIAQAYYSLEDMDSSCHYYEKALKMSAKMDIEFITNLKDRINDHCDNTKPNYYYQRGIAMYNLKRYKESIEFHERGIEKFPENSWLWNFRGNSLLADNQNIKAINSYKKSIPLYSNKFTEENYKMEFNEDTKKQFILVIYISIYDAFINLNKLDSASFYIEKANNILNKIKSTEIITMFGSQILQRKGDVFLYKNKISKAIEQYNESLRLHPENLSSLFNRALCYVEKNSPKKKKYRTTSFFLNYKGTTSTLYKKTSQVNQKINKAELRQTLFDLNIILSTEKKEAKAYLLRGIIKKQLQIFDYCMDIRKAKELGILNANEIAETNCK